MRQRNEERNGDAARKEDDDNFLPMYPSTGHLTKYAEASPALTLSYQSLRATVSYFRPCAFRNGRRVSGEFTVV